MLEKRSFTVGFLVSAYALRTNNLTEMVNYQCKRINMTPLSEAEQKESAAFMEYVANLMSRRSALSV